MKKAVNLCNKSNCFNMATASRKLTGLRLVLCVGIIGVA
jgi:hypothetical protein